MRVDAVRGAWVRQLERGPRERERGRTRLVLGAEEREPRSHREPMHGAKPVPIEQRDLEHCGDTDRRPDDRPEEQLLIDGRRVGVVAEKRGGFDLHDRADRRRERADQGRTKDDAQLDATELGAFFGVEHVHGVVDPRRHTPVRALQVTERETFESTELRRVRHGSTVALSPSARRGAGAGWPRAPSCAPGRRPA